MLRGKYAIKGKNWACALEIGKSAKEIEVYLGLGLGRRLGPRFGNYK